MSKQRVLEATPQWAYYHDPQFKAIVDLMVSYIYQGDFTPSEMRQAVVYASTICSIRNIKSPIIIRKDIVDAFETIETYLTEEK
jgi:hypothetical protein